jgi:2-amino-4-hydroxy-6-hydroxymethyldihydropteridine diphosphokinase
VTPAAPTPLAPRAGIALGSNLGRRLRHLIEARDQLRRLAAPGGTFLQAPVYQTAPVDCPESAPDFFNTVVELSFPGDARQLAGHLQRIEAAFGRPAHRSARNEPRILDLDLLYFGETCLHEPELTLPHPRMLERRFVLQPLADIRPDLVLPGDRATIREHLCRLDSAEPPLVLVQAVW